MVLEEQVGRTATPLVMHWDIDAALSNVTKPMTGRRCRNGAQNEHTMGSTNALSSARTGASDRSA